MNYTGYIVLNNEEDILHLYRREYDALPQIRNNQYVLIENKDGLIVDYYLFSGGVFKPIKFPIIGGSFTGEFKPRNPQQYCAFDLMKNRNVPIKLLTGKFGSGKTLACVVAALEEIQKGTFEKIVFVRNNVQVKDTDALGALPGSELDKMLPYVMALGDHCGGAEGIKQLMDKGQLDVVPLGFLRGRSIRNAIIYSMESENLTKEQIQLIMGRVDEGSELWMDGDVRQRDKAVFEKSKGLELMIERLAGNPLFGYVHLIKSERSPVAALADALDD